jgi:hypothetical protein
MEEESNKLMAEVDHILSMQQANVARGTTVASSHLARIRVGIDYKKKTHRSDNKQFLLHT